MTARGPKCYHSLGFCAVHGCHAELLGEEKSYEELAARVKWLESILAKAALCDECGLDYAGYDDYENACKCWEEA